MTAIDAEQDVGLTDIAYAEMLQGIRNGGDVPLVERKLRSFADPATGVWTTSGAAEIYRAAQRQGHSIRRTSDCLIASVCSRERRPLLHTDVDFDRLASFSKLQVVAAGGQAVPSLPRGRRRSRTIASVGHC